jgi:egghead protein (zeste-white 4 protein)
MRVPCDIEIVLERDVSEFDEFEGSITKVVVPLWYQTALGSKHKARGLHYALTQRRARIPVNDHTWVMHLDEESLLTEECLEGVAAFIRDKGRVTHIGQGEIVYDHPGQPFSPMVHAADSLRTGQDLALFRCQYHIFGTMLTALHGSFLLVRWDMEDAVGFDQPSSISITEDAFFGLSAKVKGAKFGWISGWVRELSPLTYWDLIQQRRRWVSGTRIIAASGLIPKNFMRLFKFQCASYPLSSSCFFLWILCRITGFGESLPEWQIYWGNCVGAVLWGMYAIGAVRFLRQAEISLFRRMVVLTIAVLCAPVCIFCEAFAAFYGSFAPAQGFYLVGKDSPLFGEELA